ncbi:hypothetical protein ACFLX4_03150 [Chloroflexota bacterium]
MGGLAWLFGFLGALCMVMGIVTAVEIVPSLGEEITSFFWFAVSGLILLMSIAFAVGNRGGGGEWE